MQQLRIISGKFRRRLIESPPLNITRPTKERIREAVFSSIGNSIIDSAFLDLFSGSGVFAIEAHSRGANNVYLVELNKHAYKQILNNLNKLNIDRIITNNISYDLFLQNNFMQFDIVYIDPPYNLNYDDILNNICESNILKDGAILYVESDKPLSIHCQKIHKQKELKYGKNIITVFKTSLI